RPVGIRRRRRRLRVGGRRRRGDQRSDRILRDGLRACGGGLGVRIAGLGVVGRGLVRRGLVGRFAVGGFRCARLAVVAFRRRVGGGGSVVGIVGRGRGGIGGIVRAARWRLIGG